MLYFFFSLDRFKTGLTVISRPYAAGFLCSKNKSCKLDQDLTIDVNIDDVGGNSFLAVLFPIVKMAFFKSAILNHPEDYAGQTF